MGLLECILGKHERDVSKRTSFRVEITYYTIKNLNAPLFRTCVRFTKIRRAIQRLIYFLLFCELGSFYIYHTFWFNEPRLNQLNQLNQTTRIIPGGSLLGDTKLS